MRQPIPFLATAFALVAPVVFFVTTLLNEKYPWLPFLVCIPLLMGAVATWFAAPERTFSNASFRAAEAWAAFLGIIMGILFLVAG